MAGAVTVGLRLAASAAHNVETLSTVAVSVQRTCNVHRIVQRRCVVATGLGRWHGFRGRFGCLRAGVLRGSGDASGFGMTSATCCNGFRGLTVSERQRREYSDEVRNACVAELLAGESPGGGGRKVQRAEALPSAVGRPGLRRRGRHRWSATICGHASASCWSGIWPNWSGRCGNRQW